MAESFEETGDANVEEDVSSSCSSVGLMSVQMGDGVWRFFLTETGEEKLVCLQVTRLARFPRLGEFTINLKKETYAIELIEAPEGVGNQNLDILPEDFDWNDLKLPKLVWLTVDALLCSEGLLGLRAELDGRMLSSSSCFCQ